MNLFKLLIPKERAQVVTEIESWTVHWKYRDYGFDYAVRHKVFTSKTEAYEFEKQLRESAYLIGCYLSTKVYRN